MDQCIIILKTAMIGKIIAQKYIFIKIIFIIKKGYRQSPIDITDGIIRECERISMKLFLNDSVNEVMFSLHDSHFRVSFFIKRIKKFLYLIYFSFVTYRQVLLVDLWQ